MLRRSLLAWLLPVLLKGQGRGLPVSDDFLRRAIALDKTWTEFLAALVGCDVKIAREKHSLENCRRADLYGILDIRLWNQVREKAKDFFDLKD